MKTASRPHQCGTTLMNGADKFAMTGSSGNPRADHLSWLSEVASAVSKGRLSGNTGVSPHPGSPLFLPSPGPAFSPPVAATRNAEARMFAPAFQTERTRHMQPVSAGVGGTGATLYYSQAPRNQTYSNFFPATYSSTFAASPTVTATSVLPPPEGQRSYLQVDNFQQQIAAQSVSSHSQAYLQQHPASPSPAIGHNRLFQQGRSILIGRFPEEAGEREPHIRIQLSPIATQVPDDPQQQRRSTDSHPRSPTSPPPRVSPGCGYRMPTGKEGSLKHRILRPPSISILDPPSLPEAPLSAPPIRGQRDSPKQARSVPSSGYRSFSSSASSLAASSSGASPSGAPSPPASAAQLKYPQSFMRGAIIQLANNQLKQVEDMTTEDFVECGQLSPTLRIDSSTVTSIEKAPATGAAKLGFHVGQDNIQITVEAPLEHPFFVYKRGWSSCSPERSAQRYGLDCHKLRVGDTCISLTDKPPPKPTLNGNNNNKLPGNDKSGRSNNSDSRSVSFNATIVDMEGPGTTLLGEGQSVRTAGQSVQSVGQSVQEIEKLIAAKSEESFTSGKRKRRWSAPDNVPPKEDGTSL